MQFLILLGADAKENNIIFKKSVVVLKVPLDEFALLCCSHSWGGIHYPLLYWFMDNTLLLFGQNLFQIVCTLWCFCRFLLPMTTLHCLQRVTSELLKSFLNPPFVLFCFWWLLGNHLPRHPGVLFYWLLSWGFHCKVNSWRSFLKLWIWMHCLTIKMMSQTKFVLNINVCSDGSYTVKEQNEEKEQQLSLTVLYK